MQKKNIGIGVISMCFGSWIWYMTTQMKAKAAFWPRIVGIGIIVLGLIILIQGILELRKTQPDEMTAQKKKSSADVSYLRVISVIVLLLVYYFLMTRFSYTISTFLLIIGTCLILKYRNLKVLIPTALVISVVLYLAFTMLFHVHFPGIFY